MNYNYISQLLDNGLTSEEILAFLKKNAPTLSRKIQNLLTGGWAPSEILSFLNQDKGSAKQVNFKNAKPASPEEIAAMQIYKSKRDIPQSRDELALQDLTKFTKNALKVGASLAVPYLASRAIPKAAQIGAEAIIPEVLPAQKQIPFNPRGLPGQAAKKAIPFQEKGPAVSSSPSTPPAMPTNQGVTALKKISSEDLFNQMGLTNRIQSMAEAGNNPEQVTAILDYMMSSKQKKFIQSQTDEPLSNLVSDYMSKISQQPKEQASVQETPEMEIQAGEPEQKLEPISEEVIEEKKPVNIEKGSLTFTPDGKIGEVKGIDSKGAIVEIDGKAKKIPIEELEGEPQELLQTVQNLLKIPEVDRSSVVSLFTYDPEENSMYIQFHTGDTYKYFDVDPEIVMRIANKIGIPVSQGKNIFGAWSPADRQSLGATLIQEIIKDPKYAKSNVGKTYKKLETLYDYWQKLRKPTKKRKQ
jgi:hypothetical protein